MFVAGSTFLHRQTDRRLQIKSGAELVGALSNNSKARAKLIESQVEGKYEKMLHPPLTYLGDAFQYRAADGKFNSVLHPHLGQGTFMHCCPCKEMAFYDDFTISNFLFLLYNDSIITIIHDR